jgi:hypothetical protein
MGLAVAEAQVAGACVVAVDRQVKAGMLAPGASIIFERSEPDSVAEALVRAKERAGPEIRSAAMELFDAGAYAERTRGAVELN